MSPEFSSGVPQQLKPCRGWSFEGTAEAAPLRGLARELESRANKAPFWVRCWSAALLCTAASVAFAAKTPQPAVRLTLESLGVPAVSQNFLEAGYSMLTAHFVDSDHLLVTYSLRGLVERIEGDPPEDDDRAVAALLVELPSGKVLARARWHLHDHAQYIWALGGGRFLLRNRSQLEAFAPVANLASGEAFRLTPFLHPAGQIDGLLVSPEGDLVTLETSPRRREAANTIAGMAEEERLRKGPEVFSFERVQGEGGATSPLLAVSAGVMRAAHSGLLPLNARGYLVAKESARNHWKIGYEGFDGGSKTLEYLDSSCPPTLQFVSPGQYVAFSCRGADDKIMVSAFDFAPHEMWEESLGGANAFVRFAYAPQSGRFALSRLVSSLTSVPGGGPAMQGAQLPGSDPATTQEVRVYQTESGDLLFRMACTPVLRAGQNFDITPDGAGLLVVRGGALEVYKLPALSGRDRKELAEAQAFEPALAKTTRVEFHRVLKEAAAEAVEARDLEPEKTPVVAAAPAVSPAAPAVAAASTVEEQKPAVVNGDDQSQRRKPPSLLNPGETTEGGKAPK